MLSSVAAFAAFAAVLTVTPGLDTMLVFRAAAEGGRRAGLAGVAGVALGCLVWAAASALGITAVLGASRLAFEALRAAGVAYLCWLGLRLLWRARRTVAGQPNPAGGPGGLGRPDRPGGLGRPDRPGGDLNAWQGFRLGLFTNLLNPKVGVFYLSVMPQFLPEGVTVLAGSLTLGAIHVVEGIVWLTLVVLAVNRARAWLTRPTVRRRLEQLTGVAFIGFGVGLALERGVR
jgi:threonine/homoserine/homoserine lactone efflux protein